jgi:hypothetical protein
MLQALLKYRFSRILKMNREDQEVDLGAIVIIPLWDIVQTFLFLTGQDPWELEDYELNPWREQMLSPVVSRLSKEELENKTTHQKAERLG